MYAQYFALITWTLNLCESRFLPPSNAPYCISQVSARDLVTRVGAGNSNIGIMGRGSDCHSLADIAGRRRITWSWGRDGANINIWILARSNDKLNGWEPGVERAAWAAGLGVTSQHSHSDYTQCTMWTKGDITRKPHIETRRMLSPRSAKVSS